MRIFVTGAAGFIGSYVAHALLDDGNEVVVVDNLNDYYDIRLKIYRLLDWHPEVSTYDGFQKSVDWYLASRSWLKDAVL